jgi:hypothetical protein
LNAVESVLREYARRGVFSGYSSAAGKPDVTTFRFVWLHLSPFTLVLNENTATLTFKDVLPHVAGRENLATEVRAFVKGRFDSALPPHRRIDAKRAEVSCVVRRGNMSITLTVKRNQYAYGARALVNLVHEVFVFVRMRDAEYLQQRYGLTEE